MSVIVKVRAIWSGFPGAPGYTNWYGLSDGDAAAAANALGPRMRTFFDAVKAILPDDVSIKVERTYQVLESTTGNITSEGQLSADPAVVDGTVSTAWAAAAGCSVNWLTGLFNAAGHRIVGRTYLVPLAASAYENDGTLTSTALGIVQTAASAAVGGTGSLLVVSRPTNAAGDNGTARTVVAASVHDKVSLLKSRRD